MKKIILKYGGMLAALAMVFTTLTVNSTCTWMTYQEELPDTAKNTVALSQNPIEHCMNMACVRCLQQF